MKNFTIDEIFNMIEDTNELIKKEKTSLFGSILQSHYQANSLANEVEFWKWMAANYKNDFGSIEAIKNAVITKPHWVKLQLQGKGYEWDFMCSQRNMLKNFFSRFEAGDCPTQAGIDIIQKSLFDNSVKETFQLKASTGKTVNPNLSHTPQDAIVVTTKEKVNYSKNKGFSTIEFKNADKVSKITNKRFEQTKSGNIQNSYNLKNVSSSMASSGAVGCILGITTEGIGSYKRFKRGEISGEEYLLELAKAGADSGITASITTGINIPLAAKIATNSASPFITIPVSYVIGKAVNKIVAPCFGRGEYRKILNDVKYYQNLELGYLDLINQIEKASNEYTDYISNIEAIMNENKQLDFINEQIDTQYEQLKTKHIEAKKISKNLYDSI